MQTLPDDANSCAICDSGWLKMSGDTQFVQSALANFLFVCQLTSEYSIMLCSGFYIHKHNRNIATFLLALNIKRAIY